MTPIFIVVAIVVCPFALFGLAMWLTCRLNCETGALMGFKAGAMVAIAMILLTAVVVALYGTPPGKVLGIAFPVSVVLLLWCASIGGVCGPIVEFVLRWARTPNKER